MWGYIIVGIILLISCVAIYFIYRGVIKTVSKINPFNNLKSAGAPVSAGCSIGYNQPDGAGGLCYKSCLSGFHQVGCCVCSMNCPYGWTDTGTGCIKPSGYDRGVGTIPINNTCSSGRQLEYGLCYTVPENGYTCTITMCTPICPSGYIDIGQFCQKGTSYGRGAGTIPNNCPLNYTKDPTGLLCYPNCPAGYITTSGGLCKTM